MKRITRTIAVGVLAFLLACMCAVSVSADSVNGIAVSEGSIAPGGEFTVTITVPPAENADTASVKVSFDPQAFEVLEWEPEMPGSVSNAADGVLIVMAANVDRLIDLSGGMTLTAKMRAAEGAAEGTYTFELTEHSFCYVTEDGFDFKEVWEPVTTAAQITVGDIAAVTTAEETTAEETSVAETTAAPAAIVTSAEPGTSAVRAPDTVTTESPAVIIIIVSAAAAVVAAVIIVIVILRRKGKSQ